MRSYLLAGGSAKLNVLEETGIFDRKKEVGTQTTLEGRLGCDFWSFMMSHSN